MPPAAVAAAPRTRFTREGTPPSSPSARAATATPAGVSGAGVFRSRLAASSPPPPLLLLSARVARAGPWPASKALSSAAWKRASPPAPSFTPRRRPSVRSAARIPFRPLVSRAMASARSRVLSAPSPAKVARGEGLVAIVHTNRTFMACAAYTRGRPVTYPKRDTRLRWFRRHPLSHARCVYLSRS